MANAAVAHADQVDRDEGHLDLLAINTIRTLAMDAVQKAESGHPGTPMALAPVAFTLWNKVLRYDPADPTWPNRDRFVLSVGHASMLLYSLLCLAGVKTKPGGNEAAVTVEDIKKFRQIDSRTPGHPEYGFTVGVETTTGPLGQGCGNSVGMAMASRWMGAHYNKPGATIFDFDVYNFCSDGDLMEGVASEAASLGGHLGLSNLCWIYDDNKITIEGDTPLAFSEDVGKRFESYQWNVIHLADANDTGAFLEALHAFKAEAKRPTIIIVHSIIGYGFPTKAGTHKAHSDAPWRGGDPRRQEELRLAGGCASSWCPRASASISMPASAVAAPTSTPPGRRPSRAIRQTNGELAGEIDHIIAKTMPEGWDKALPVFPADEKGMASRAASGKVINAIAPHVPWFIGGSADLAPSTKTNIDGMPSLEARHARRPQHAFRHPRTRHGRDLQRHGGVRPARLRLHLPRLLRLHAAADPALRADGAAQLHGVHPRFDRRRRGRADPPAHRAGAEPAHAIPGLTSPSAPVDANEVAETYRVVMERKHHSRRCWCSAGRAMPTLDRTKYASAAGVAKGAYVLADAEDGKPQVILMGTGTELHALRRRLRGAEGRGHRRPRRVDAVPGSCSRCQDAGLSRQRVAARDQGARHRRAGGVMGWERYRRVRVSARSSACTRSDRRRR